MKKITIILVLLSVATICIASSIAYLKQKTLPAIPADCRIHYSSRLNDRNVKMLISFNSEGSNGIMSLNGFYQDTGNPVVVIHRMINFEISRERNRTRFLSNKITFYVNDKLTHDMAGGILSDFYFKENKTLNFNILAVGDGVWLFKHSGLPVFYCYSKYNQS